METRTTMLAGVSHDLRTILTRFKLELALLKSGPGNRRDEEGRRRDGPHARGLSGFRQGDSASSRRRPTWARSSTN
jgi:two-component system osmolarity sensor histidine kinase EnvZ